MTIFSGVYVAAALTLFSAGLGDPSLVYANILNLSARIAYCLSFATHYFRAREPGALPLRALLPPPELLLGAVASRVVIARNAVDSNVAEHMEKGRAGLLCVEVLSHVALGGVMAVTLLSVWAYRAGYGSFSRGYLMNARLADTVLQ